MLFIIVIFFISIILIEIYSIVKIYDYIPNIKTNIIDKENNNLVINFTKYTENESFVKKFKPGYLYTDEDINLFVITQQDVFNVKKNKIYKLNDSFNLEFINVDNNNINYYYNAENN
jgi:hypothetical protein